MSNLPVSLSENSNVLLPQKYEAARTAIAECEQIDECKTWSDKAAALASYARQAKDDSLRVMAVRIQARAERRCGELLKLIPAASGENLVQHRRVGTVPSVTRTQAAREAGLSDRQRKTALRIATIPVEQFDYAVESQDPPNITALAALGTQTHSDPFITPTKDRPADSAVLSLSDKDQLAAAHGEIERQAAEISNLKRQVEQLQNENEALRERIAIMEAG